MKNYQNPKCEILSAAENDILRTSISVSSWDDQSEDVLDVGGSLR